MIPRRRDPLHLLMLLGVLGLGAGCPGSGSNSTGETVGSTGGQTSGAPVTEGTGEPPTSSTSSTGSTGATGSTVATGSGSSSGMSSSSSSGTSGGCPPDCPAVVDLQGAAQKGPFILGSSVTISPLKADGAPTGQQFAVQTVGGLGEYAIAGIPAGPVALVASGFYFDEVRGVLSDAPLTLRATQQVVDAETTAHIHVLTHLVELRGGGAAATR